MCLLTIFIEVDHLATPSDANMIKEGLQQVNGIYQVVVDIPASLVKIAYFNNISVEAIRYRLQRLGYPDISSVDESIRRN